MQQNLENQKKLISEFLQCIATTHECVPEEKKVKTEDGSEVPVIGYQGPSPDEVALLEFAQNHGFEYTKGSDDFHAYACAHDQLLRVLLWVG